MILVIGGTGGLAGGRLADRIGTRMPFVAAAIAYSVLAGAAMGALYTLQGVYSNHLTGTENFGLLMAAQQRCFRPAGPSGPPSAAAFRKRAATHPSSCSPPPAGAVPG